MNKKVLQFGLTPDQIDLQEMVHDFGSKELTWDKMINFCKHPLAAFSKKKGVASK